eukprot:1162000-Pelagomonas_calceolata.AAC.1
MSSRVYLPAESAHILPVKHISDHCVLKMNFRVDDAGSEGTDWNLQPPHVYAEILANTKKFRSNLNRQLMKISVCAPLRAGRTGSCYSPKSDAACKQKRKVFREAVQSGQAEHACKLYSKNPEFHVMLRQPKRAQITPLAKPAWVAYLNEHFRTSTHQQPQHPHHGRQGLSAREIAVSLGRNHPSPEVLLRRGARADWTCEPNSVSAPSLDTMRSLDLDQIKKTNGSALSGFGKATQAAHTSSFGFDNAAAPFMEGALVLWPKLNAQATPLFSYIPELAGMVGARTLIRITGLTDDIQQAAREGKRTRVGSITVVEELLKGVICAQRRHAPSIRAKSKQGGPLLGPELGLRRLLVYENGKKVLPLNRWPNVGR